MAGSFKTELPTMQTAAAHVQDVNARIQSQLSTLMSRLEPLAGTWQGGAASSFQTLKQRWHDDASKLNAVLHDIGDGLTKTHANYSLADTTNDDGFTKITGSL